MQNFIVIQQVHHFQAAVFQLPTARGEAFMYEQRSNYMNDERAVVEVAADKFLELWRMPYSSHPEVAMGNPKTWPHDYKFHWSDEHFAKGIKNPRSPCAGELQNQTEETGALALIASRKIARSS